MTSIRSIATAVPEYRLTQADADSYLASCLPQPVAERFARALAVSGNRSRFSVLPMTDLLRLGGLDERLDHYREHAVRLGERVGREALAAAGVEGRAVGSIVCVSSTGYMMPGLDAHLINRLGLLPTCRRAALTQLGCAGGVGATALATALVSTAGTRAGLVVSVELPTLSLPVAEPSPTDIVSALQFGDGAAAAVLRGDADQPGLQIVASQTVAIPDSVERDGIRMTASGLRLVRPRGLTQLIARSLPPAVAEFLRQQGVEAKAVRFWAVHPRTAQILDAVANSLGLGPEQTAASRAVWQGFGNMVSASIFFVLQELRRSRPVVRGELGMMLAVGAGMSCEMLLLRQAGN